MAEKPLIVDEKPLIGEDKPLIAKKKKNKTHEWVKKKSLSIAKGREEKPLRADEKSVSKAKETKILCNARRIRPTESIMKAKRRNKGGVLKGELIVWNNGGSKVVNEKIKFFGGNGTIAYDDEQGKKK
eukprot:18035_1